MSKEQKPNRPKARLAKGFRDIGAGELRGLKAMLRTIERVYESYGFEPVEQPFIEYTDALGKFLPDQDRPNEGVFSFQDDDDQWLSLRYDLTAPLARHVAENQQSLPMPYRSYRQGWVFRNEKPGPGRYRQFMQFDADTVGTSSPAADAEVCMMAADTMEALGIKRGQYVVNVNSRKILDGVMESISLGGPENSDRRLVVLRAMDKFQRLGSGGVRALLGVGRRDESGDFTTGAQLDETQTDKLMRLLEFGQVYSAIQRNEYDEVDTSFPNPLETPPSSWDLDNKRLASKVVEIQTVNPNNKRYDWSMGIDVLGELSLLFDMNETLASGIRDLAEMESAFQRAGYVTTVRSNGEPATDVSNNRIMIDPSVVRGLEYYTGPVFECELLMETKDEDGRPVRFGSVGGGGRYDDLVARFTGQQIPATGFSIGVSRLYAALQRIGKAEESTVDAPVVVLVMDRERIGDYQRMVTALRNAGIRAEMYLGTSGMKAQMKYADKRGAPLVVIQGGDEKAKGEVQIKDLRLGAELAKGIESREDYAGQRLAQFSVPESELVDAVKSALARDSKNP